jgi:transcriptional regulator with XRE-family HTH domain
MTTPREDLANMLRDARVGAGIGSQAALAQRLHVSRPLINRAESPTQPLPSDAVLTAWAGVTGCPVDKLLELAERVRNGTPDWFMDYAIAEANATMLRSWSPLLVPGLLQTPDYARSVFAVAPYTPQKLAELVTARIGRQAVIGRATLTAIIDQHVLERCVGSPSIMAGQCTHLVELVEHADIALHVIPHGVNLGMSGAFDIATRDTSVTVLLWAVEDIPSTSPSLVTKVTQAYERLLGAARDGAESLTIVRTAEQTWKKQT